MKGFLPTFFFFSIFYSEYGYGICCHGDAGIGVFPETVVILCYTIVVVNAVHSCMCAELRVCVFMRGGEMEQAGTEWPVWVWENFCKALV